MHILSLSPDSISKPIGGLGVHLKNVLQSINDTDHAFTFDVITWTDIEDHKPIPNTWERNTPPMTMRKGSISSISRHQSRMIQKAISLPRKPHIIHAHDWSTFDAGRLVASFFNIPLVTSLHLSVEDIFNQKDAETYIDSMDIQYGGLACSTASGLVSSHYYNEYRFACNGLTKIIGNGIDVQQFNHETKPYPMPGQNPIKACYIGRISEMKNVINLMKAPLPYHVDLILCGEADKSCADIYDLADQRRHLIGPLYGDDKLSFMRSADIAIFPSTREPYGIVGLEWMACRVPLVASFVGGMVDYMDEDTAIRCDTTPEGIGEGIEKAVRMERCEKEEMVEKALRKVSSMPWKDVADKYIEMYEYAVTAKMVHPLLGSCLTSQKSPCVIAGSLRGDACPRDQ